MEHTTPSEPSGGGGLDERAPMFKVIVLGNSGVGKSALTRALSVSARAKGRNDIARAFRSNLGTTMGMDVCTVNDYSVRATYPGVGGKAGRMQSARCALQIWDTAGQERFRAMTETYMRGAHGVLFVCDCTDPASVAALADWRQSLQRAQRDDRFRTTAVCHTLCVTKADCLTDAELDAQWPVWRAMRAQLCPERRDTPHVILTSAKDGSGVDDLLEHLARRMLELRWEARGHSPDDTSASLASTDVIRLGTNTPATPSLKAAGTSARASRASRACCSG